VRDPDGNNIEVVTTIGREAVPGNWEVPPAAPGATKAQVTDCYKERHVRKRRFRRRKAATRAESRK
jgi:hypothetical protein